MISIRISLIAKDVANALAMIAEFAENGITVDKPRVYQDNGGQSIVRAASPSIPNGGIGEHEQALQAYLVNAGILTEGRRPTLRENTVALFVLEGDREAQCQRFLSLIQSGEAIRTVSGWKVSNGNNQAGQAMATSIEIDPDECV